MTDTPSRRSYLASLAGTASIISLAGCTYGTESDQSGTEPTSTPTPEPTSTSASPPDPIEHVYSGTGDDTATLDVELAGPTGIVMEHTGSANFIVEVYNADGEMVDLVANKIGSWAGANLTNLYPEEHTIDITASGDWSLTATEFPQYFAEEVANDWPIELTGRTDTYFGPVDFTAGRTMSVSANGEQNQNTIVMVRDGTGAIADLVVNEIGAYEGSSVVSISGDIGWIDVQMSGEFELILEK